MAEERTPQKDPITYDDMRVLRVLMHEVQGINAVSGAPAYMAGSSDGHFELDLDQSA